METNLDKIRMESIVLARSVPIIPSKLGVITHPFTNMCMGMIQRPNTEPKFVDLTNTDECEEWLSYLSELIKEADLLHIYMMLNTPWKLTWLKFCKPYMSEQDFAKFLADAWISMENPNQDANVKITTVIPWFKNYPKEYLMVENDLDHWKNLPDEITLYRGVGKTRNPYGLSYTASEKLADWFQNRFYKDEGFLITLKVKKEDVLVYFNTRGEDEYVVNTDKYKKEIKEQIPK